MNCKLCLPVCVALVAGVVGSIAIAQPGKDKAEPAMQLPPGWTSADMEACIAAGTPGDQHKWLAKGAGTWTGTCEMWMTPGAPAMKSDCTSTTTSIMDGRYVQVDHKGEMPGMGLYHGNGVNGFDNISGKFVGTWIDNHGTGIMFGTGELSKDGKTLSWSFTHNCPLTKKPTVMREIQTFTSDTTMTMEMFGADPKTGKEYKIMRFEMKKQS